ncbi:hypothetical protein EII15_21485 [Bacillus licheniformis]|uniref:hypothetical protein n=1 Tax=Bacillus licheniformis TaxID=1402 RepID=UPI000F5DDA48|nr:hypothetical protein [Bacillus licheniformis]RRD95571.1 hypothetical protein EII15_21485 [Bacillus licheniformis]
MKKMQKNRGNLKMKNQIIRGVSIHTAGNTLHYYVHYDSKTVQVSRETYDQAVMDLRKASADKIKLQNI